MLLQSPQTGEKTTHLALQSLAEIMDIIPFGLFVLDQEGRPMYANACAEEILGAGIHPSATPDTLARSYSAFVAGTDELYPAERMPIVRALAGEVSTVDDMEVRSQKGTRYLEVTGTPVLDPQGRVKYAVAVFHDITAAREVEFALRRLTDDLAATAEERARQLRLFGEIAASNFGRPDDTSEPCGECWLVDEIERAQASAALADRALKLFLSNFNHEIRTPLNQIIGFSDLIESHIRSGRTNEVDRYWENIRESGRSLLDTIDRIVTVAESERNGGTPNLEILDVEPFMRELADQFRASAEGNGNRLELVLQPDLGRVQTDTGRVRAALQQIVGNACKHCKSGSVTISASRSGDGIAGTIEVRIRDTGPGIDPRRAERLVQGHLDPGDPLRDAGLGIGIPLAARSLDAIGGSLGFSTESGRGTTFVARIPTYTRS